MKYIYIIVCISLCVACKSDKENINAEEISKKEQVSASPQQETKPAQNIAKTPSAQIYHADTFVLPNGTLGYDILNSQGKKIIHQDRLPGLPGLRGFENISQANCVADMMIEKMSKGIMPPSINIDELKHCGIKTE